jgi:hypothetical protein
VKWKIREAPPRPSPKGEGRRIALVLVVLLLLLATGSLCAQEDETYTDDDTASVVTNENYLKNPGWYLRNIDSSKIPTGILIDRVKFRKDIGLFNGNSRVKTCEYASWRKIYQILKGSANDTSVFPYLDNHLRYSKYLMRYEKTYPIGLINIKYNKIKRKALQNALATETNNDLVIEQYDSSLFATKRLIIANTFQHRVHGDNVKFLLDSAFYFSNIKNEKIIKIEVNFDNGTGWQEILWNIPFDVKFNSVTSYLLVKIRLTVSRKAPSEIRKYYAHFTVFRSGSDLVPEVSKNNTSRLKSAPIPDEGMMYFPPGTVTTMQICLPVPLAGTKCYDIRILDSGSKIEYCILYGQGNTSGKLRRPIIICDGFDPNDNRDYFSNYVENPTGDPKSDDDRGLYELMTGDRSAWTNSSDPGANLISELLAGRYDIVFVNWTDGTGDIPINADNLRRFLKEVVNSPLYRDNYTEENILVGPSMAGIISRYCLTTMEQANPPEEHHVKLWFAFDSPQEGAYIPIGLQVSMYLLKSQLDDIDGWALASGSVHESKKKLMAKLDILNSEAAKQMLIYHYSTMGTDEYNLANNYQPVILGMTSPVGYNPLKSFNYTLYGPLRSLGYPKYSKNIAITNGAKALLYNGGEDLKITQFELYANKGPVYINLHFNGYALKNLNRNLITFYDANNPNISYTYDTEGVAFYEGVAQPSWDVMARRSLYAGRTIAFDNAPGGYHTAIYDFNQNDGNNSKPLKNDYFSKVCFMPTVSAFGIVPTQANIYKTWDQINVSETPFDELYGMQDYGNEEHCRVSYRTSIWLQNHLSVDRSDIQKPYPRTNVYTETETNACLYASTNNVTFGGVPGSRFVFKAKSANDPNKPGADVNIMALKSIKFLPGTSCEKGAKLHAKMGILSVLKSGIIKNRPKVNYLSPSPFVDKVFDYSENNQLRELNTGVVNNTIFIYPNPANDFITLKFVGKYSGYAKIQIRNTFGQVVLNSFILPEGEKALNVVQLPKGLYFLDVSTNSTGSFFKFVKD